jgi:peptidoglycan hydrolase CwlO-like protein
LQVSQSHEADLQASVDELQLKLDKEVGLCRDLTSDLNRANAELAGAQEELEERQEELEERREESEALTEQVQQLQV